jgi:hypothetical protein
VNALNPARFQPRPDLPWQFRNSVYRGRRPRIPLLDQSKLNGLRIDQLREAIRGNRVSFPSQVPTFEKHDRPDLQRRLVQLYFVLGWSCERVGARHGLIHQRVRQILTTWKCRAVAMGYIQYIPADPWARETTLPMHPAIFPLSARTLPQPIA